MYHSALQVPEQALWGNISEIFLVIGMRISLKSKQNWNKVSGKYFQVMTNAIIREATACTVVDLASNKNRSYAMCDWFQVGLQFRSAISESFATLDQLLKTTKVQVKKKKKCISQCVLQYLLIFWFHIFVWCILALLSVMVQNVP